MSSVTPHEQRHLQHSHSRRLRDGLSRLHRGDRSVVGARAQIQLGRRSARGDALRARAHGRAHRGTRRQAPRLGKVLAWEPPYRILLRWRLTNFAPEEASEVEVRFAPAGEETRVTIEHRGLNALRPDHPARHGQGDPQFEISAGNWWREILGFLKTRAETSAPLGGASDCWQVAALNQGTHS